MKPLSPFMLRVHRFAVAFQLASVCFYAWVGARYDLPGLGLGIGWAVMFGALSSHRLMQHRKALKAEVQA